MDFLSEQLKDNNASSSFEDKFIGITTGIVKENWDDKHKGMVKVEVFLGEKGKTITDWVRVASSFAGKNYGEYFLPEIGDEVILSFNLGNPNRPYVIGSLWSDKNTLPSAAANKDNSIKKIVTKCGHEIVFDENKDKENIIIRTPKKMEISLDDEKEIINIKDKDGKNLVTVNSKNGEIDIKADKTLKMSAAGKSTIEMNGSGITLKSPKVTIEAQQQLGLKGQKTALEGNMVEIKGSGSTKINSSAILELKGAMTKIN